MMMIFYNTNLVSVFLLFAITTSKTIGWVLLSPTTTNHVISITKKIQPQSSQWYNNRRITTSTTTLSSSTTVNLPRLSTNQLNELKQNKYIAIPNFIPLELQRDIQNDIQTLRSNNKFNIAKIGQDQTNTLNTDIRIAETCFIGNNKLQDIPNKSRNILYDILDNIRNDISNTFNTPLDNKLTELLYVYYPNGGYYRRHRDAIPNSASTLRKYSLLLYMNDINWDSNIDGGELRIHFDSGGDMLPKNEEPNYIDISPKGGTLVLFQSDAIPHEVLDTNRERMAVVGWYNRPVQISDAVELSDGSISPIRLILLAVAAGLVTVGVLKIIS